MSAIDQIFENGIGSVSLTLGGFDFGHAEIPEKLNFGGEQLLNVHQLIGGKRVIDTMGRSDADISWSGMFIGEFALERAKFIDNVRATGQQITFQYSQFLYNVVVKSFSCSFERFYQIPYQITLSVIEDLSIPITVEFPLAFGDAVNQDLVLSLELANIIKNGSLTTQLLAIAAILGNIPSLASATQQQLSNVVNSINSASSTVGGLITNTTNQLFGSS